MRVRTLITVVSLPAALAVAALTACGSTPAANGGSASTAAPPAGTSITMEVLNGEKATEFNILGPDGRGHDSYVPSQMTVLAGKSVSYTVINYDEGPHTFTIPELNINQQIPGRKDDTTPSVTTFNLTFPKTGTFRFYCALPCDGGQGGWAMTQGAKGPDQENAMAGYVSVVSSL